MKPKQPPHVVLTNHAFDRLWERTPAGRAEAIGEVVSALGDPTRRAKKAPRWAVRLDHRGRVDPLEGWMRWVWNPELTRAYLVVRRHGTHVVVTVYARPQERSAA
jgi:hypothetical protein